MLVVDSIVISCIYRQVILAILQCSVRLTLVQYSSQNRHLCIWQMCMAWLNACMSFFSPLIILILVPASLKKWQFCSGLFYLNLCVRSHVFCSWLFSFYNYSGFAFPHFTRYLSVCIFDFYTVMESGGKHVYIEKIPVTPLSLSHFSYWTHLWST